MTRAKPHDGAAVCQTCVTPFVPADASSSRTCCMCGAYTSPNMTRERHFKHLLRCSTAPPSKSHFLLLRRYPTHLRSFEHRRRVETIASAIDDRLNAFLLIAFHLSLVFSVSVRRAAVPRSLIKCVINWNLYFALTFLRSPHECSLVAFARVCSWKIWTESMFGSCVANRMKNEFNDARRKFNVGQKRWTQSDNRS